MEGKTFVSLYNTPQWLAMSSYQPTYYLPCEVGPNVFPYLYPTHISHFSSIKKIPLKKSIQCSLLFPCIETKRKKQSHSVFPSQKQNTKMPSKTSLLLMPHFLSLFLFLLTLSPAPSNAQDPPSPGYNPSSQINSIAFDQGYRNLWGPKHQSVDQGQLTIWLDSTSGLLTLTSSIFLLYSPHQITQPKT